MHYINFLSNGKNMVRFSLVFRELLILFMDIYRFKVKHTRILKSKVFLVKDEIKTEQMAVYLGGNVKVYKN